MPIPELDPRAMARDQQTEAGGDNADDQNNQSRIFLARNSLARFFSRLAELMWPARQLIYDNEPLTVSVTTSSDQTLIQARFPENWRSTLSAEIEPDSIDLIKWTVWVDELVIASLASHDQRVPMIRVECTLPANPAIRVRAVVKATGKLPFSGDAYSLGWTNVELAFYGRSP